MTPTAAARRLRERKQDGSLWAFGLDGNHCCCCTQQSREWIEEVLAAYEAISDDTPLDEAWLRSVGFVEDYGDLALWHERDKYHACQLVFRPRRGVWLFGSGTTGWQTLTELHAPPATRGQLRLLALALGIELNENHDG